LEEHINDVVPRQNEADDNGGQAKVFQEWWYKAVK
jgi:hypothetical protein